MRMFTNIFNTDLEKYWDASTIQNISFADEPIAYKQDAGRRQKFPVYPNGFTRFNFVFVRFLLFQKVPPPISDFHSYLLSCNLSENHRRVGILI